MTDSAENKLRVITIGIGYVATWYIIQHSCRLNRPEEPLAQARRPWLSIFGPACQTASFYSKM